MKHKVSELEGAALDLIVALAAGLKYTWHPRVDASGDNWVTVVDSEMADSPDVPFAPSRSWHDGGPIIEREVIQLWRSANDGPWRAALQSGGRDHAGSTPLVAAMRAYVASKLGDEVELPEGSTDPRPS